MTNRGKQTLRPNFPFAISALLLLTQIGAAPAQASPGLPNMIAAASEEMRFDRSMPQFDKAIANTRIVFLGEPWHGDGGAIATRAALVRYLHERHGFDVLVFEADFYSLHRGWEQALVERQASSMARDNVYSFWSQTAAAAPLWQYVDQGLLAGSRFAIAGIDTKLTGRISREQLPRELEQYLARVDGISPDQARNAATTLRNLLNPGSPEVTAKEFGILQALIDRLATGIKDSDPDGIFWRQVATNLQRNLKGEYRDPGMTDNLIWLAEKQYPGRKIIVWTHNNHALMDKWAYYDGADENIKKFRAQEDPESIGRRTYLGEATRRYFGRQATYAIATVSFRGRYSTDIGPALTGRAANYSKVAQLKPSGPGSLEGALSKAGRRTAFVDLRPFRGKGSVLNRALDYTQLPELRFDLADGYDGLIYLRDTHGLNDHDP